MRMQHRPWLKYVHWLGYVTSLIVIVELVFVGYFLTTEWVEHEAIRDGTRIHEGPASDRLRGVYYGDMELALLNQLPSLSDLGQDGLRIIATPSFGDTFFAISLRHTPAGADGKIVMTPVNSEAGLAQSVKFKITSAAYLKLTSELDRLSSNWTGEASGWTDGTGIVYERIKSGNVTSGFGNSPNFYGKIGAAVFEAIRPSVSQLSRFENDGHPKGNFD